MAPTPGLPGAGNETLRITQPDGEDRSPIFTTVHYNKIPVDKRGAIRVLVLQAGDPGQKEVNCQLIQGTILYDEDRPHDEITTVKFKPYDALSWCWGKEPADAWISILKDQTRYKKYVQPELVAALRALRHKTYDRYLWVDAVCINQDKDAIAEKNVGVCRQL